MSKTTLYFGTIWHTPGEPATTGRAEDAFVTLADGALAVGEDGRIIGIGPTQAMRAKHPKAHEVDYRPCLIMPGFVDTHVHFPQIDVIGSYGEKLLGWLDQYTYPAEMRLKDPKVAVDRADRFVTELYANGTTLAAIYSSVHQEATEAMFSVAEKRGLRAIIGKASMDRAAPTELCQKAADDIKANEQLIKRWHGKDGRLFVALTPRFAVSCSQELLDGLGKLKRQHPSVYVQSHHAETLDEIKEVKRLFPQHPNYLSVYDRAGLLDTRTVMGHGIHVEDAELELYHGKGACVAHCPTSNLFLGSGLLPLQRLDKHGVRVTLGTDIGGGTRFSLLATMGAAYKVQHLAGSTISPVRLFHMATLGGAKALGLDKETGSFEVGKQADFQVLDWRKSRLLSARFPQCASAFERLMALCFLGDDRLTQAVYVGGREVFSTAE